MDFIFNFIKEKKYNLNLLKFYVIIILFDLFYIKLVKKSNILY